MKLKEWLDFNSIVLNSGKFIIKVLKEGSYKTDDILFVTTATKEVCKDFFGNFEVAKNGIMIDKFPDSDCFGIRILLWPDKDMIGGDT